LKYLIKFLRYMFAPKLSFVEYIIISYFVVASKDKISILTTVWLLIALLVCSGINELLNLGGKKDGSIEASKRDIEGRE
jgi:hypothetical protein